MFETETSDKAGRGISMLSLARASRPSPRNRPRRSLLSAIPPGDEPAGKPASERPSERVEPAPPHPGNGSEAPAPRPVAHEDESVVARLRGWIAAHWPKKTERAAPPRDFAAAPSPQPATPRPAVPEAAPGEIWQPLIDPMKVIAGVTGSKKLILATTILGGLLGAMIALSTPKLYFSSAELLVDPRDLKLVERNITETGLPSDATLALVENQVRVLTSGNVIERVVDRLHLDDDPEFNGNERSFSPGALIGMLRGLLSRTDALGSRDMERALAVKNLAESLSVERGGKTFVIDIGVRTRNPEKSALIANTLTEVFLEASTELQADTVGRASDELNAKLSEMQEQVAAAERKVEDFKAAHDIVDAQGRLISDDEIVKLNDQLATARARTLELNARAASAGKADVDAVLSGDLPEQIASSTMTELRAQYAALKQQSDMLAVRLGPRHPQRQAIDAQLSGLRTQINQELKRVVASFQVELQRAVKLEQDLASRLAQLKARQGNLGDEMVTLRELERDAATKRSVYEAFLLRARETGEQKDINRANMSVISKAYPALEPTGTSRAVVTLTGAFLGFLLGIGLGAGRGALASLRDRAAEEEISESPFMRRRRRGRRASDRPESEGEPEADAGGEPRPEPFSPRPAMAPVEAGGKEEEENPMTYPYPDRFPPQAGPHTGTYPHGPMPSGQMPPYPQQPYGFAPQPQAPYPVAPGYWPQPPVAYDAYGRPLPPVPAYAYPPQHQPQPQPQAAPQQPDANSAAIEEIRASLREFREAVRSLTESRARRSFF